jgi:hypothetical protein
MRPLRVLVACEFSGTVRQAFAAQGWDSWSCDLLPSEDGGQHIQGDVRELLAGAACMDEWDLLIAHPPCTYLCSSGLHWNTRVPGRQKQTEEALLFVKSLLYAPIQHIAVENPVGCIGTRIRKADQIIQPHQFGHDASKQTCLWLKNLPPLVATKAVAPRLVNGKPRWANQTDSGQNRLGMTANRWALRSLTYPGIAAAMADQWGAYILSQRAAA